MEETTQTETNGSHDLHGAQGTLSAPPAPHGTSAAPPANDRGTHGSPAAPPAPPHGWRARLAKHRRPPRARQKLGFLRLWEFIFFSIVASNVVALMADSQGSAPLDFDSYLSLADALCSGVVLWLITQRKRVTRPVVCVYTLLTFVVGIIGDFAMSDFEFTPWLFLQHGRGIFVIAALYFFFSRKVRLRLDKPFDMQASAAHTATDSDLYRLRDIGFWRDIAIYFMVFSVVGHWMERIYATFMRQVGGPYDPTAPLWESYLAPFSIYGIGAVLCILLLFPLKQLLGRHLKNVFLVLLVVYIVNTLVCTGLELAAGLAFNHPGADGKLIFWDYSNMPLNFMGQICLQNALLFGAVATLMVWAIFPSIEGFNLTRSADTMNAFFVAVFVIWLMLAAFYVIPQTIELFFPEAIPPAG